MANYDIIGNICILKIEDMKKKDVDRKVKEILKKPNIKTVVGKIEKIKGRLRTTKIKHLAGIKTTIAKYRENSCIFKLDIEKCYFSPRLSNDRLETAGKIKKDQKVLVMFSGAAPYPIVIAKKSKAKEVIAIELGRECNKYAEENIRLNKLEDRIKLIPGDVKKKVNAKLGKFDVIMMARPNLKYSFLKEALKVSKRGTLIIYHGFCRDENINKLIDNLIKEAKESKKKIKILRKKQIGDIAPYKHRYQIEIRVVS